MNMRSSLLIAALLSFLGLPHTGDAQECPAAPEVCAAADRVVMISGFEPVGSATIVGEGLLVTNRHMVADLPEVTVAMPSGARVQALVIPTTYPGDLVLLEIGKLSSIEKLPQADATPGAQLHVIGFDLGREAVRVYPSGKMIVPLADTPLARLHMDARALPGNSGGAVVNSKGQLVAIVASGGEGRNEAIPASEIERLIQMSNFDAVDASEAIGGHYRNCVGLLNESHDSNGPFTPDVAEDLAQACLASNNRQLMDLAGQAFGNRRDVDRALELLEESHAQDPNAPNTLISLAITYHIAGRFADEIPVLRRGLALLGDEPQLLRLSLQAGIWGGDQELADLAMERIQETLPAMAPAARRFYDAKPPAPQVRPPG